VADLGQLIDEEIGGGTGADANNALGCEFRLDLLQSGYGNLAF
jgi:hypothetical protein